MKTQNTSHTNLSLSSFFSPGPELFNEKSEIIFSAFSTSDRMASEFKPLFLSPIPLPDIPPGSTASSIEEMVNWCLPSRIIIPVKCKMHLNLKPSAKKSESFDALHIQEDECVFCIIYILFNFKKNFTWMQMLPLAMRDANESAPSTAKIPNVIHVRRIQLIGEGNLHNSNKRMHEKSTTYQCE